MNNSNYDNLNYRPSGSYKSTNDSPDSQKVYHSFLDDIFPEDRINIQEPINRPENRVYQRREALITPRAIDNKKEPVPFKSVANEEKGDYKRSIIKKILILLCTIISLAAPIVNFTFRLGYVYIDHEVYAGFSEHLFYVMVAIAIYSILYAVRAFLNPKKIKLIWTIVFIFFSVLGVFFTYVNFVISTIAYIETALIHLKSYAPYLVALIGVPFLLFLFPLISKKKRNIIAIITCLIFLAAMAVPIVSTYPLSFKFLSDPVVFDIGNGNYSVVFGVNADSQGFVEYEYQGTQYKVYSIDDGLKKIDQIHAIHVPREHLENNTYRVGTTKVITKLAYGGKLGETLTSDYYGFQGERKTGDLLIRVVSDWHHQTELLEKSVSYLDDPDLVIILGDYADFFVDKEQIIKYMLVGAASVSYSTKPVIYVRGNHETRFDTVVPNIPELLGLDNFYYQVERGDYLFTVLDSGESEPDDHWQHLGFNDYKQYLTKELDWFESLPVRDDVYNIVLSHDFEYAEVEDISVRFRNLMKTFNASMEVSGHYHNYTLDQIYVEGDAFDYYKFIDGGLFTTGPSSIFDILTPKVHEYYASQIKFEGDSVHFIVVSDQKKIPLDETKTKIPTELPPPEPEDEET
ncbi:MAG: metallophosphoesterase [Christensenellaceae bacterium]|jgi:predicted phosphodiesterase|nr:metallophosphoesterase [Christensenellaceae bacterium]